MVSVNQRQQQFLNNMQYLIVVIGLGLVPDCHMVVVYTRSFLSWPIYERIHDATLSYSRLISLRCHACNVFSPRA